MCVHLRVDRIESDNESTLGRLYLDGRFQCWTLEDQYRTGPKVRGETRIPAGTYQVGFRTEGGFHAQYAETYGAKFGPDWHKGMLHVTNVPGFDYILIHVGNSHDDTAGCLLVGHQHSKVNGYHYIGSSRPAYEALYPLVRQALLAGEEVLIEYLDLDPATAPVATDAVVTTNAQPTPAVSKPMEQTEHKEGHTGVVAGTAGAAGAAVVAVGAAEVLNEGGLAGSTSAPEAVTTPGPDLVSRLTDPDNLTKLILIGLGVVVVVCAIYFVARRVRARKR
jgi:hypothetical protein